MSQWRCDNGLPDDHRCNRAPYRDGYNPLGLCIDCLRNYRKHIGSKTAIGEDPVMVLDPGRSALHEH